MLSVGLKMKLLRKTFPVFLFCLKTCQKGQPSIFTIWWITFFTVLIMEFIELNWLYKHIKKIRSSQPAIPVLISVNHQSFPVRIVKRNQFLRSDDIFMEASKSSHIQIIIYNKEFTPHIWKTTCLITQRLLNFCVRNLSWEENKQQRSVFLIKQSSS